MDANTYLASSVEQFCDRTGLGRSFVFAEIRAGKLPARKAGRRLLILERDAETYLAALPASRPLVDEAAR